MQRTFQIDLVINGQRFRELVIDSHYEKKHGSTVNDQIILELIAALDGIEVESDAVDESGFKYFVTQPHYFEGKPYRLVWLLPPDHRYLGIVNCYRRSHAKE